MTRSASDRSQLTRDGTGSYTCWRSHREYNDAADDNEINREDGFPRFDENDMPAVCAWSYMEARMHAGDSEPDEDASAPVPKANAPSTLECAIWMPPNDVDVRRAREDGLVCVGELVGFHSTVPASSASGPAPIFDFRRDSSSSASAPVLKVGDFMNEGIWRVPSDSEPDEDASAPVHIAPPPDCDPPVCDPPDCDPPDSTCPPPTDVPTCPPPTNVPGLSSDSSEGSDDDDARTDSKSLLQPGYTVHNSGDNRFYPRPESSNKMPRRH